MQRPSMIPLSRRLCKKCLRSVPLLGQARPAIGCALQTHHQPLVRLASTLPGQDSSKPLNNAFGDVSKQTPPPADKLPTTDREEALNRARMVFGSPLAGPFEREKDINSKSVMIAGVLVPPRPEEPDNCCMSGCVNCVWERYQDELQDWSTKSAEARTKLESQRSQEREERIATRGIDQPPENVKMPTHVASSMDDDGGGSEALWSAEDLNGAKKDLMEDIPVGIREFMKNERKLKERRAARDSA